MTPAPEPQISVGDAVSVPWELEERTGVVQHVDEELERVTVEVSIEGHPERFSYPLSAVSSAPAHQDAKLAGGSTWAGGVDDNTVLKAVLEGVGPGRRVSVHLTPTRDEDDEPLLLVDVILLDPGDQKLPPEELLSLQTDVRNRVFEAIDEASVVIVQVLPRETSAA
jgi:hypothetical protein